MAVDLAAGEVSAGEQDLRAQRGRPGGAGPDRRRKGRVVDGVRVEGRRGRGLVDRVPAGLRFLLRSVRRRAGRGGQEKGDNEENENGQRNPLSRGLLQEGCLEPGSATTTSRFGAAPT